MIDRCRESCGDPPVVQGANARRGFRAQSLDSIFSSSSRLGAPGALGHATFVKSFCVRYNPVAVASAPAAGKWVKLRDRLGAKLLLRLGNSPHGAIAGAAARGAQLTNAVFTALQLSREVQPRPLPAAPVRDLEPPQSRQKQKTGKLESENRASTTCARVQECNV